MNDHPCSTGREPPHHPRAAFSDGTIAVDMDPLSLLCRLATSVPPPRFDTVKYAGVLAPASPWRSRLAPQTPQAAAVGDKPGRSDHAGGYRPWAELLARTFSVDVLACPRCQGRMKLLGLVKNPAIISRTLATVGEATEVPQRSPGRGPPYWKSSVLRRQVLGDEDGVGRPRPPATARLDWRTALVSLTLRQQDARSTEGWLSRSLA